MQTPKDKRLNHTTLEFVDSLRFLSSASLTKISQYTNKNNKYDTSEKS